MDIILNINDINLYINLSYIFVYFKYVSTDIVFNECYDY